MALKKVWVPELNTHITLDLGADGLDVATPIFDSTGAYIGLSLADGRDANFVGGRVRQMAFRDLLAPMTNPPTITLGTSGAGSTINANAVTAPNISKDDPRITYARSIYINFPSDTRVKQPSHVNFSSSLGCNAVSVRFCTASPVFEIMCRTISADMYIEIDGQPVSTGLPLRVWNTGSLTYVKVDFGADVQSYEIYKGGIAVGTGGGGTGHANGDIVTLAGGTSTSPAKVKVIANSGGVATSVALTDKGNYSVVPSGFTQASSTGAGTGLVISGPSNGAVLYGQAHTTRKMRRYEIWGNNSFYFGGLNLPAGEQISPWPMAKGRWIFVGDSRTDGQNNDYPGGQWWCRTARRLGVEDAWGYGVGSTGYLAGGGGRPNARDSTAYIAACAPDVIVTMHGINDLGQDITALQSAVSAYYTDLMARLPRAYFYCFGLVPKAAVGATDQQYSDIIKAGFSAAIPAAKGKFIDVLALKWFVSDGTYAGITPGSTGNTGYWIASDNIHWPQVTHDYVGDLAAVALLEAMRSA